jgi:hypothetical protein
MCNKRKEGLWKLSTLMVVVVVVEDVAFDFF